MKAIIEKMLDIALRNQSFQAWVDCHNMYSRAFNERKIQDGIEYWEYKGVKFHLHEQILSARDALKEYDLRDIRPDDVVLDLGANIGGFSLYAAQRCEQVYAVEPIYTTELEKNMFLNKTFNITVMKCAVGSPHVGKVEYLSQFNPLGKKDSAIVEFFTIDQIIEKIGSQPEFLKCDIEGDEKYITQEQLKKFRRVEMEVHDVKGNKVVHIYE